MQCLRCGRCCFYFVGVIHPDAVKENLDFNILTEEDTVFLDGTKKCPHLEWNRSIAICKIHHYTWFKDTPCGQFTQVESNNNTPCRIGALHNKYPELMAKLRGLK